MRIKTLLIYIEPTPYIVGLIEEIKRLWPGKIRVLFLTEKATQPWGIQPPDYCKQLPAGILRSAMMLRRHIKSGDYAALHLAGWGHSILMLAMLLGWIYRIPVFVESDTQAPFQISLLKRILKRLVFPLLLKIPDGFLPGGSRQAKYLRAYGVPENKIQIAQMTVDVEAIMAYAERFIPEQGAEFRERYGLRAEDVVFIYVGRLEPYKCIVQLLQAFQNVASVNRSAKLLLVGGGSLRETVNQWTQANDWLTTTGRLDGEHLLAAYCSADVFVLPSYLDSWGLVVNEAMAAGLPVIASNRVGCVDDLVAGKDTGLVYDFDAPDALIAALQSMLGDPQKRRRFGENARRLISGWTLAEEARRVMKAWSGEV